MWEAGLMECLVLSGVALLIGILGIGVVITPFIIFLIIYFGCFHSMPYDKWTLKANSVAKKLKSEEVFRGGRAFKIATKFIEYDVFPITVEWIGACFGTSYGCWLELQVDGKNIYVEASFQYQILENQVIPLFETYGTRDYELIIEKLAYADVKSTLQDHFHDQSDYLEKRSEIREAITKSLNETYIQQNITLVDFQLGKIDLPDQYESVLLNQLILKQEEELEILQAQYNTIESTYDVLLEEISKELQTIELTTEGTISEINYQKETNITKYKLLVDEENFNKTIENLGLEEGEDLLNYFFIDKLQEFESSNFFSFNKDQKLIIEWNN